MPNKKVLPLTIFIFALLAVIILGIGWFFASGATSQAGFGWFFFSFAAGLTMIVLPCTLPLAFVIVPLSMGRGVGKGLRIALAFGLGVAITLSVYGVLAAVVGRAAIGSLGAPLEAVKNWLYLVAGIFVYVFALSSLGLVRFKMPSYTGAAPSFIQKKQDYVKALLLGLFLGNIGVGCPHPATPLILLEIARVGDLFYGWSLFFIHAVGRILPLLLLAALAIAGINALNWLMKSRDKLERGTAWAMVFVAGFILVLGLFTHDWWVYSGQHTLLESLTGEEGFLTRVAETIGTEKAHAHEVPMGTGLFGLPLALGNWVLVFLWVLPLWWCYLRRKKALGTASEAERAIELKIMPWRFWFNAVLTALLALTFIWVVPDRFLNHANMGHPEDSMGAARDGHVRSGHYVDLESEKVTEGISVRGLFTPLPAAFGRYPYRLGFYLEKVRANATSAVAVGGLEIEHDKPMHVIGVRDNLGEFFHIHPKQSGEAINYLETEYAFVSPGMYKIWSELKEDGQIHSFGHPKITVGGGDAAEKKPNFSKSANVFGYEVVLDAHNLHVGGESDIVFSIARLSGEQAELLPYLGEKMHLAVIKDDLSRFVHTHPEEEQVHSSKNIPISKYPNINIFPAVYAHGEEESDSGEEANEEDGEISFHVNFPEPGLYKLFAQFRPEGEDLGQDETFLAEFWVEVREGAPGEKVWLFIVSVALIVLLSLAVKKFLRGAS
ncbi:MAG: hypothetical protein HYT43_00755 [Candidatus Taylorbacteria bacterium]|nr:hypothetical protein [Candidatus Taylorbacteria bacterium]